MRKKICKQSERKDECVTKCRRSFCSPMRLIFLLLGICILLLSCTDSALPSGTETMQTETDSVPTASETNSAETNTSENATGVCTHSYSADCATVCLLCGEVRQPLQEHTMVKARLGVANRVTKATCISPATYTSKVCSLCGYKGEETYTYGKTADHQYDENGVCKVCHIKEGDALSNYATVVGKNGTKGAITFSFDDNSKVVATWLKENYPEFPVAYSLITKYFGSVKLVKSDETYTDEDGDTVYKKQYEQTADGRYVVSTSGKENDIAFWRDILATTNSVFLAHTHTHEYSGNDNTGGLQKYSTNAGSIVTDEFPINSVYADLAISRQILKDLFGEDQGNYFVDAGVGVSRTLNTTYWNAVAELFDGARFTNKTPVTFENYSTLRYKTAGWMCTTALTADSGKTLEETREDQLQSYLSYLESAADGAGWVGFCIHNISPDDNVGLYGHPTSESMMKAMMEKALELEETGKVWLGRYDEVAEYYQAVYDHPLAGTFEDGCLNLTLAGSGSATAVSVRIFLDAVAENAVIKQDGAVIQPEVKTDENGRYVIVNMVPGSVVTVNLK